MLPLDDANSEARVAILSFLEDIAHELHDTAPLKSSTTRAYNLYKQSGVSLSVFQDRMYEARAITKDRTSTIKRKGTVKVIAGDNSVSDIGVKAGMPYFFAILEERLGLREGSPTDKPSRGATS